MTGVGGQAPVICSIKQSGSVNNVIDADVFCRRRPRQLIDSVLIHSLPGGSVALFADMSYLVSTIRLANQAKLNHEVVYRNTGMNERLMCKYRPAGKTK